MSQTRIILLAHGSRDPQWIETFERLAMELAMEIGVESVALAYMEFALPSLADAARREHPQLEIELLPPIGEHPTFRSMVREIAHSAISEDCYAAEAPQTAINGA